MRGPLMDGARGAFPQPRLEILIEVTVGDPVDGGIDLAVQFLGQVAKVDTLGIDARGCLVRLRRQVLLDEFRERGNPSTRPWGRIGRTAADDEVARVDTGWDLEQPCRESV